MTKHLKAYLKAFKLKEFDPLECEICGKPAVDIHHLDYRGMGGNPSKDKDVIENLMALCRPHHNEIHNSPLLGEKFRSIHLSYLKYHKIIIR